MISAMLEARKSMKVFGRGKTNFLPSPENLLIYTREMPGEKVVILNNLSSQDQKAAHPVPDSNLVILHAEGFTMDEENQVMKFEPHGFAWFAVMD